MSRFVRFVVRAESENAYWLTGIFTVAEQLRAEGRLHRHEAEWLEAVFEWFNAHLPCPPFERKRGSGEWTGDAVSWFRDSAEEPLQKIWELVALLREHDVPVRLIKTQKPGRIVYADDYQIVAETPRWGRV